MATRATIKIKGITFAKVYKHWDGYPSATLEWLKHFNKNFVDQRGQDPEYKFAQLLRSSSKDAEMFDLDNSEVTGWGVIPYNADFREEFEYTLENDSSVTYVTL